MGENELYHYGVLGMKWGVRKKRELVGRKQKRKKKPIKLSKFVNKYTVSAALVAAGALFVKGSLDKMDKYYSIASKTLDDSGAVIDEFIRPLAESSIASPMILKDPMTRWIFLARHFLHNGSIKSVNELIEMYG